MTKEKRYLLIFIILIIPFLEPTLFRQYSTIHKIFMIYKMISAFIIMLNYIMNYAIKGKTSKIMLVLVLYQIELIFSTIINNGDIMTAINNAIAIITVSALIEYTFKVDAKISFCVIYYIFGIYTILNFINVIISTRGTGNVNGSMTFLLGIDNRFIFTYLPMICFGLIYNNLAHKKNRLLIIFLLVGLITVIYTWSVGAVLGISLLACYIVFILKDNNRSEKLTFKHYILIIFSLNILIVFFQFQNYFSNFITVYLGKDVTFSGRTFLWNLGISEIEKAPFWGYGINETLLKSKLYGLEHFHNYFVNLIYQGGLISLLLFLIMNIIALKKIEKYKNTYIAKVITFIIFTSLILSLVDTLDYTYFFVFYLIAGNIEKLVGEKNDRE